MISWQALVPPTWDHRIRWMPVVTLNLIGTCDSRCVACDYWKRKDGPRLDADTIGRLVPELRHLGTRIVLLSGGEPLSHADLPRICERLHRAGFAILLHTNGLRLEERLGGLGSFVSHVFVSLDGATRKTYRRLRGVDGLPAVLSGIDAVRRRFPRVGLGSRTVLMRDNLGELEALVELGLERKLRPISFLGLDVHSEAFGRASTTALPSASLFRRMPSSEELDGAEAALVRLAHRWGSAVEEAVEGGTASIRRILGRYRSLARGVLPEAPRCNTPWHSAVIEPDGAVRPCFFQASYGKLGVSGLEALLNEQEAVRFRRRLDVTTDPLCRRCVCSKHFRRRDFL